MKLLLILTTIYGICLVTGIQSAVLPSNAGSVGGTKGVPPSTMDGTKWMADSTAKSKDNTNSDMDGSAEWPTSAQAKVASMAPLAAPVGAPAMANTTTSNQAGSANRPTDQPKVSTLVAATSAANTDTQKADNHLAKLVPKLDINDTIGNVIEDTKQQELTRIMQLAKQLKALSSVSAPPLPLPYAPLAYPPVPYLPLPYQTRPDDLNLVELAIDELRRGNGHYPHYGYPRYPYHMYDYMDDYNKERQAANRNMAKMAALQLLQNAGHHHQFDAPISHLKWPFSPIMSDNPFKTGFMS